MENRNLSPFHLFAIIFLILLLGYHFLFAPSDNFPIGKIINIEEGTNLRNVSLKLKQEHIIRSRLAFEAFIIIYDAEKHLIPADYLFDIREPVYEVAKRISKGERHLPPIAVTIPEGYDISDITNVFVAKLPNFNKDKFILEAKSKEGYLFPDTYFFFTTDNEENVIKSMSENFQKKIASVQNEIYFSGKTAKEIIIMASIIEKEAKGSTDRKLISGILWKRLAIDMPFQVDAAPETYRKRGLPENPIANPGMEAILAAIHPENSVYLYYLHDIKGNIHYAKTFAEHKVNKLKYLK